MLQHILKGRKVLYGGFFTFSFFNSDNVEDSPTAKEMLAEHDPSKQTGMDRLHYMFSTE